MQPEEFIESLHRHYAKRHVTPADQIAWTREMIDVVKGNDPKVMRRAYELIRDEYDERAFPLPAVLKKFIYRAAEQIYPESMTNESTYARPRIPKNEPAEFVEACRRAQIWQAEQIRIYGSWDAQWRATRHTHVRKGGKVRLPLQKKPPARFALSKLRKIRRKGQDVSRPAMELLQRVSRNRHLHVDHNALARRITGERYE